ncbi:MAG TPA: GNAT family N-acetyltransferase [Candidatus Nanoarchaeia archaeon]|nr:GNAT family N-acetyltransferase [Candidatus Nanoarchaeia archaeon]
MEFELGRISLIDIPALRELFVKAADESFGYFPERYRDEMVRQNSLSKLAAAWVKPERILLGCKLGDQLAGFAIGGLPETAVGYIYWLYVDSPARGSNLGLKLLARMMRELRLRGAERIELITHDIARYYIRQGFEPAGQLNLEGIMMQRLSFKVR